jgi:hypothetical protein
LIEWLNPYKAYWCSYKGRNLMWLERLGGPRGKSASMGSQLDRRARMDAERDGTSYEAALARLLGLMAQGWATPGFRPKNGE